MSIVKGSDRIIYSPESDPGWQFILLLEKAGLASDIKTPDNLPERKALRRLNNDGTGWPICKFRKRLWQRWFRPA